MPVVFVIAPDWSGLQAPNKGVS